MEVLLANPRGFCAGVDRAIAIVERALESFGAPIYVRHEVVHNRYVVEGSSERGAVFVDELHEVPDGATVIFSAHGVSKAVRAEAEQRGLQGLRRHLSAGDQGAHGGRAPGPRRARRGADRPRRPSGGRGHHGPVASRQRRQHPSGGAVEEVSQLPPRQPDNLAYVTQTTLSVDDTKAIIAALRERFPAIEGPRKDDICYATQNRQDAVRRLADAVDVVLVVGSHNSSNSNRLRELAAKQGTPAYLIDGAEHIDPAWLEGASASA